MRSLRWQVVIILVIGITVVVLRWWLGFGPNLLIADTATLGPILGIGSAAVGVLASLVFCLYLSIVQTLHAELLQLYAEFRRTVENLEQVAETLPRDPPWPRVGKAVGETLHWLSSVKRENLPIYGEDWKTLTKPIEEGFAAGLDYGTFQNPRPPFDRLVSALGRVEESASLLGVLAVGILTTRLLLGTARKAFGCVATTVLGLLVVGFCPPGPVTGSIANGIALGGLVFTVLLTIEILSWASQHLRDLEHSINRAT